jgi:hypothetical protein
MWSLALAPCWAFRSSRETISAFPKRTLRAIFAFRVIDALLVRATEDLLAHYKRAYLVLSQTGKHIFLHIDLEPDVFVFAEVAVNRSLISVAQKYTEHRLCGLLVVGSVERERRLRITLVS